MGKDFAARHAVYVGAAVVLKLICGADDCVWLSPFLAKAKGAPAKAKVAAKYVTTVVLITCVAAGLALAIRRIAAPAERRADEGIGTAAGVLLVLWVCCCCFMCRSAVANERMWARRTGLPSQATRRPSCLD